jgi:glycosyltransferase involved in cell wall biosynthesis
LRPVLEYSIVIPTHNRVEVLPEVVAALATQRDAPPFEVIVVDDGSTDATAVWLGAARGEGAWAGFTALRQANRGPAAARNRGVRAARGRRVAFLGDDTIPAPDWLAWHARAAREREPSDRLAVIGYTGWHRRLPPNPFLDYINEQGAQFGFALIADRENVPFNFFYTSNLSLARDRLLEEPFDEGFPHAAWEDIEASYRLFRRSLRLVYEPRAVVAHDHPTDLRRFGERQSKAGYSAVVFYRRHPELGGFLGIGPEGPPPPPAPAAQWCRERLAAGLQFFGARVPGLWERILRDRYIQGLRRGWSDPALGRAPNPSHGDVR